MVLNFAKCVVHKILMLILKKFCVLKVLLTVLYEISVVPKAQKENLTHEGIVFFAALDKVID